MTASIEKALGEKLDVAWNLTLAANLISANVTYGQIEQIKQVRGVKDVILETRYEPQESTTDATAEPNMLISAQMTGTNRAWGVRLHRRRRPDCHHRHWSGYRSSVL